MDWEWNENSVLHKISPDITCKELYNAICFELGRYFSGMGFKYLKSKRMLHMLVFQDEQIKLEINIKTSRHNMPGKWVAIDIFPEFSSIALKEIGMEGFLFDEAEIYERNPIKGGSWYLDTYMFNGYEFSEGMFKEIIALIEGKIIPWIDKIKEKEGVKEIILRKRAKFADWSITNRGYGNTVLPEYISLYFPELIKEMGL